MYPSMPKPVGHFGGERTAPDGWILGGLARDLCKTRRTNLGVLGRSLVLVLGLSERCPGWMKARHVRTERPLGKSTVHVNSRG